MFCIFKRKAEAAAILESHLAARGGRIFSAYFFHYNCLLRISINYTENVTDLYAHAQTVDTRRSSPIFQAPGYEAKYFPPSLHLVPFCQLCLVFSGVHRRVVEGSGLGSPGCVVFFFIMWVMLWTAVVQLLLSIANMVCLVHIYTLLEMKCLKHTKSGVLLLYL